MRLLTWDDSGSFKFTDYYPAGSTIPPYAILSHRWGPDEVTYEDLKHGTGLQKSGYNKIRFCAERAKRDGLQHFWIDAYVSCAASSGTIQDSKPAWHASFYSSSWFTRGWTLQELLAPAQVDVFSKEGERLGSKESLEHLVCTITGIPASALRGIPLPKFSFSERMAWAERRETTIPEDRAYSLLGIFSGRMQLL
ncbi:HET-domain-containing protein [Xylariaceae sp. FL0594]|nr:HET-domain-containing protein [Xylariaceae sp. FL0594]